MKREYPKQPITAVGVAVFKNDKVLLIKRNKPPKSFEWSIPGGAQNLGEPLLEAAKREVYEETGVVINTPELIDAIDYIKEDETKNVKYHYSLIDYAAHYVSGTLTPGDDAVDAKWVSLDELDHYNLWSETVKFILKAADKRKTD